MSFTNIPEEGEGTRTWVVHTEVDDPTLVIERANDSLKSKKGQQQQKQQTKEVARDEALAKVQAEEMKNTIVFTKLICEYCGEDFRDGHGYVSIKLLNGPRSELLMQDKKHGKLVNAFTRSNIRL